MLAKDQKIFVVWTNEDLTEGRGVEYAKALCWSEVTARRLAKGAYVQGSDCRVTKETVLYHEGKCFYPGARIVAPSEADILEEKQEDDRRQRLAQYARALAHAKQLGIRDEDLKVLSQGVPM